MRADAIAQYLIWKRWPRWAIIRGDLPADKDFVAQIQRSAKRYGGKIVDERVYTFPPGARNLDSGHQQVQAQIPMATEGTPANDALWVANTDEGFGDYLLYRTYSPSLVVGTQGLQALAWDKSYTESGAMHLQNALPRLAKRKTTERDYTAWLGVRALADSAMRSHKTTPQELKAFLLSDEFKLEGFKGQALTFRTWDHQMRQPIILGGGTRVPRLDLAAGRLPAREESHRHAWLRRAGDQVQIPLTAPRGNPMFRLTITASLAAVLMLTASHASP